MSEIEIGEEAYLWLETMQEQWHLYTMDEVILKLVDIAKKDINRDNNNGKQ